MCCAISYHHLSSFYPSPDLSGSLTDFVAAHDLSAAHLRLARIALRLEELGSAAPTDLCAAQIRVAEAGALCGLAKTTTYDLIVIGAVGYLHLEIGATSPLRSRAWRT